MEITRAVRWNGGSDDDYTQDFIYLEIDGNWHEFDIIGRLYTDNCWKSKKYADGLDNISYDDEIDISEALEIIGSVIDISSIKLSTPL